jgi:putative aldouronate transport system substrate-binding protein
MKKHTFFLMKRVLFLTAVFFLVLAGCSNKGTQTAQSGGSGNIEDDLSEQFTYTFAVVNSGQFSEGAQDFNSDAVAKHFEDKFNFKFGDVTIMTWADWVERPRIWISSGDMPDWLQTDFSYADYKSWYDQELIKKFPADWQTKYPNLYALYKMSGISEFLEKNVGTPPAAFNNILFKNNPPTSPVLAQHGTIGFRKDWARAMGITEFKTAYKLDELLAMVEKFQKEGRNLPGVTGQTDTWTMNTDQIIQIFMFSQWNYADKFYKDPVDGKYKWGPDDPRVFEFVKVMKDAVDRGIVSPNFASFKNDEEALRFFTGGSFMAYVTGWVQYVFNDYNRFQESVGLDPFESIQEVTILDPNGNYVVEGRFNNWSVLYFSPAMSDKKFHRLLTILDYTATKEAQDIIHMGFEGKDYTMNGNEYVLNRPLDPNGNPQEMFVLYPYSRLWYHPLITWDDFSGIDPSKPKPYRDIADTMWATRQKYGNDTGTLLNPDVDLKYFNGPNYLKWNINTVRDGIIGVITQGGDLRTNYDNWIKSMRPVVDPILNELNNALTSK